MFFFQSFYLKLLFLHNILQFRLEPSYCQFLDLFYLLLLPLLSPCLLSCHPSILVLLHVDLNTFFHCFYLSFCLVLHILHLSAHFLYLRGELFFLFQYLLDVSEMFLLLSRNLLHLLLGQFLFLLFKVLPFFLYLLLLAIERPLQSFLFLLPFFNFYLHSYNRTLVGPFLRHWTSF